MVTKRLKVDLEDHNEQDPNSKETIQRKVLIKRFVQKVCTPVSEKRLQVLQQFLKKHFDKDSTDSNTFSTRKEYTLIWKGIYYAIWSSEMGKGCEEMIEEVGLVCDRNHGMIEAAFMTLEYEWEGIDSHRVDKFAYLLRRLVSCVVRAQVEAQLSVTSQEDQQEDILTRILLKIERNNGLMVHLCVVYIEEVFKVILSDDSDTKERKNKFVMTLLYLMKPLVSCLTRVHDERVCESILKDVVLQSVIEMTQEQYDIKGSQVVKYFSYLKKMLEAFYDMTQSKWINKTLSRLNDSTSIELLLEAREIQKKKPRERKVVMTGDRKKRTSRGTGKRLVKLGQKR